MHPFGLAMAGHDIDAAVALLAPDVTFRSPVVFTPYRGRDAVAPLLYAVADVLHDFRYTREIGAPDAPDLALVFEARAGDKQVEGCDFLHLGDSGLIDELFVMIRPMSGVHALAAEMRTRLEKASSGRQPSCRAQRLVRGDQVRHEHTETGNRHTLFGLSIELRRPVKHGHAEMRET